MLKKRLDKIGATEIPLSDLSNAFDSLPHELLIAKVKDFVFDINALNLIQNYISIRKQRTNIISCSSWL